MKICFIKVSLFFAFLAHVSITENAGGAQTSLNGDRGSKKPASTNSVDHSEARIPVDSTHTPGDAEYLYIISAPGSYYLRTNILGLTDRSGINIASDNVTLDLNGFSLLGTAGAINGITIWNHKNVVVRNGFVSNWGPNRGVLQCAGISAFGSNILLENLVISDNQPYGVYTSSAVTRHCTVSGSSYGVFGGSAVTDCRIDNNGTGIFAFSFSSIKGNTCTGNRLSIFVDGSNSKIDGNSVVTSGASPRGIEVRNESYATNNVVVRNIVNGGGSGNYSINQSLNDVGPIGSASTNTSPWGNISD